MPVLPLDCHLPTQYTTHTITLQQWTNNKTNKSYKQLIYIYIYISHVNVTQTVPDISPLMPMHQYPLLVPHLYIFTPIFIVSPNSLGLMLFVCNWCDKNKVYLILSYLILSSRRGKYSMRSIRHMSWKFQHLHTMHNIFVNVHFYFILFIDFIYFYLFIY